MSSQADLVGTPDGAIAAIHALIAGARNTQLIYVAAKLGLADMLYEGPRNAAAIAAELGVNAPVLRRLLRALVNRGLVAEEGAGNFSLTALGEYLRTDAVGALRDHAIRSGEIQYPALGSLLYAVETGQSAFEHALGTDFWEYMGTHPAVNNAFTAGMTARAESIVNEIVAAYDFSPFATIVDVGGGEGVLLSQILATHSASAGILYDLPAVTQKASAYLAKRGLSGRAEVIAGDFFAAVPRGDLLVLMAILHGWDNERAALILRQCRKALKPNGRILIIEDLLPSEVNGGMSLIEIDLSMLVCHNGQVRTLAEHEELLEREGFRLESVNETGDFCSLITASVTPKKLCQNARPREHRVNHAHPGLTVEVSSSKLSVVQQGAPNTTIIGQPASSALSRFPLAVSGERFEDPLGRLGPHERPGSLFCSLTHFADVGLQLGDAAVRGSAELALVNSANHRSTRFIREKLAGVKWRRQRGCFSSHALPSGPRTKEVHVA